MVDDENIEPPMNLLLAYCLIVTNDIIIQLVLMEMNLTFGFFGRINQPDIEIATSPSLLVRWRKNS